MKHATVPWIAAIAILAVPSARAVPVLSDGGMGILGATGTFGATGNIYEYRLAGTPGLQFSSAASDAPGGSLTLTYTFLAAAAVSEVKALAYLDADIDVDANTWFNERGEALPAAGGAGTWEIDEPGFGVDYVGDIYHGFLAGAFDNSVFNGNPGMVEDVAMGLGFDAGPMGAGDALTLQIILSESALAPGWGTVLHQWDADDGLAGDNLYFAGRYSITRYVPPDEPPSSVPEPASGLMLALGAGILVLGRKRLSGG